MKGLMKNFFMFFVFVVIAAQVMAIDAYTIRQVRDPVQLSKKLTTDFASVVSTSDSARVSALEATSVTNATIAQGRVSLTNVFGGITNVYLVCTNVVLTLQRN